jgi:TonB family protein
MKRAQPACVRVCSFLLVLLFFASATGAQLSRLDDLASRLAKELKPLNPHLVAVADFRSSDGAATPQGHYFAAVFSDYLRGHAKKKFTVANHMDFDRDLGKLHISAATFASAGAVRSNASLIGADVVVTGTVDHNAGSLRIDIVSVRIADQKSSRQLSQTLSANEFLESMATPFPAGVLKAGIAGVSLPTCIQCPDPRYSDLARRQKISGDAVLMVLVSSGGAAEIIHPVRLLGYGLDEQAYYAIKNWRFKAATTEEDGKPVAVIVPVQVTFRLY